MDSVTFPVAYARWIRSVIAVAIREARLDAEVRSGVRAAPPGYKLLPDSLLDRADEDVAVVAVIRIPTEDAQLREAEWPDVPPLDASRFPGFRLFSRERSRRVAGSPNNGSTS